MDPRETIGYWIRRRRKALDLTQEALAQRVGCAVISLRKIEADARRPSSLMARRLAQCLALSPEESSIFLAVAAGEQTASRMNHFPQAGDRVPASNLPVPMTLLIGRSAELKAIMNCLRRKEVRLHSLTGPVGVGKTRLAVEAGLRLLPEYRDGVFWVSLDSLQDPERLPFATAAVLGVREARGRSMAQSVADFLAQKEMLLIFDNFEQLLPGAALLSFYLACAPGLRLLVTSRTRLRVYGEHEYVISPMPAPEADSLTGAAEDAVVRLFCERAQAVRADFTLTPDLVPEVVEICRRLDGLPLAIELAAAHIKLFSVQELLQRLDRRLPFFAQGSHDLPPRAQVLDNAIAWSYSLLSPSERTLLNRLAVFVSGFTLTAAEAVCAFPYNFQVLSAGCPAALPFPELANGLAALLDHSLLLRQKAGDASTESRFRMLEILREYAQEQLQASGDLDELQRRHAEYFTRWAEQAVTYLYGIDQAAWLERLDLDGHNLRTALSWSLAAGWVEMAARLACALAVYWRRRGYYSEGRSWLERVLPQMSPGCLPDSLRARLLQAAGSLAYRQGDCFPARRWLEESLNLFRSCGDQPGMAKVLFDLGWIKVDQGDWVESAWLNQESLALARAADDSLGMYRALTNLGWTSLCTGERSAAESFFCEAHEHAQRIGHIKGIAVSLANLGWIALYQDNMPRASVQSIESLRLCHLLGEREVLAECLEILTIAAVRQAEFERAARLSGASQTLWESLHVTRSPNHHSTATHAEAVATLHRQLPAGDFSSNWQHGSDLSLDAVVEFALGQDVVIPS